MSDAIARPQVRYSRLIAPVVLILFAVGWYQFSAVYIQGADNQLVASDNLAVYVTVQQVQGYMAALLDATYFTVAVGLIMFAFYFVRFLRARSGR